MISVQALCRSPALKESYVAPLARRQVVAQESQEDNKKTFSVSNVP